jgi:phage I-like protein
VLAPITHNIKAGGLPRFVITLDAPLVPENPLVRIPLAITGKWIRGSNEFSITLQDLQDITRNFRERLNGEINVDYDHASEMPEVAAGGPIPSAGRIVKLDPPEPLPEGELRLEGTSTTPATRRPRSGRYILWGWYEPTDRARKLIKDREYRYISPALDWTARNKRNGEPQGTTLTSVALTNRPFLEELPQIRLSDPGYELSTGPDSEAMGDVFETKGGLMKKVNLSVADGKIKIAHPDLQDEYFAEPQEVKDCLDELGLLSDAALASSLQQMASRPGAPLAECLAEIRGRLAALDPIPIAQARSLFSEAEARGKMVSAAEFFRAEVERELNDAVVSGKILPRQREDWRKIALSDLRTFRNLISEQKPQVPLQPMGFSGAVPEDVQAQVKFMAEQRMRERQITFGQALTEIGREQPDLFQQYRRSVSGN